MQKIIIILQISEWFLHIFFWSSYIGFGTTSFYKKQDFLETYQDRNMFELKFRVWSGHFPKIWKTCPDRVWVLFVGVRCMVLRPSHPPLWMPQQWSRKTMHRPPTSNTHTRSGHAFQIFGRRCPDWVWVLQMALSKQPVTAMTLPLMSGSVANNAGKCLQPAPRSAIFWPCYGPLRGHGFDMGMIFANRPHARTLAWVISSRKIWFSESRVMSREGGDPMQG